MGRVARPYSLPGNEAETMLDNTTTDNIQEYFVGEQSWLTYQKQTSAFPKEKL